MLKKIGKYLLGFVLGLIVLCTGVGVIFIWPMMKRADAAKPKLSEVAQAFAQCREKEVTVGCLDLTTKKFQDSINSVTWEEFNFKTRSLLGKRMSAELVPNSMNISTFNSFNGEGTKDYITVQFRAIYEKDAFVTEKYTIVRSPASESYLIESYNVQSNQLIK